MESILSVLDIPYQINIYSNAAHGFAVRCDMSDPNAKYAKEQAFLQAMEFFRRHMPRETMGLS
jgi:dienelactone hydrolase